MEYRGWRRGKMEDRGGGGWRRGKMEDRGGDGV